MKQPFDTSEPRNDMAECSEATLRRPSGRGEKSLQQCTMTKLYQWFVRDGVAWFAHGQPFKCRKPRATTTEPKE